VGSARGLKTIFGAMERQYRPDKAAGFGGDVQYDLLGMDGQVRSWTVTVGPGGCSTRQGSATAPKLTIKTSLSDFVRMAGLDLDPAKALLTGRMDLEGDITVAMRLSEMFGRPPST
jgi:putative sterol carrier protein